MRGIERGVHVHVNLFDNFGWIQHLDLLTENAWISEVSTCNHTTVTVTVTDTPLSQTHIQP